MCVFNTGRLRRSLDDGRLQEGKLFLHGALGAPASKERRKGFPAAATSTSAKPTSQHWIECPESKVKSNSHGPANECSLLLLRVRVLTLLRHLEQLSLSPPLNLEGFRGRNRRMSAAHSKGLRSCCLVYRCLIVAVVHLVISRWLGEALLALHAFDLCLPELELNLAQKNTE